MHRPHLRTAAVLAALSLLLTACPTGEEAEPGPDEEQPPDDVDPDDDAPEEEPAAQSGPPPEVEQAAAEWPLPNRDYENTRATMDAQIDADNVDELGLAWSLPLEGVSDWGAAAVTPLILDGVVYMQQLQSDTSAIDLESGEVLWERVYDRAAIGPNGPAVGWGKVFIQDGTNQLIALDMDDGEEVWITELEPHTGTHQPSVFDGRVYTGTGAGEKSEGPDHVGGRESYTGGSSGMIYAVDQDSGDIHWEFQVVEEGFWGNPEVNGGGGLWYPPAIDTDTGLSFWGTGNPSPFPGTVEHPNAESRPGPNLYTNALVALDGDGELDWYNQVKPRDLFDLDFQSSPILATAEIDGDETDLVIGSGKLGEVYAFDRETGDIHWEVEVGEHQNNDLQEIPLDEETVVLPGVWGGVETPMALADGELYVLTLNLPTPYTGDGHGAETPGESVAGAEGNTNLAEATSEFLAIDVETGEVLWEREFDISAFGGATVVNDLVFTATHDGVIHALSRDDGETVWSMQAPGGIIAWPAIVDDTIVWPVGLGREPSLLALRLGADGEITPPEDPAGGEPAEE